MSNITKIAVIVGSAREARFADKPAAWIADQLRTQSNVEVDLVDLQDFNLPFFDAVVSPSMIKEPYANEAVAHFTKKIAAADAFVIITPEYNHGPSAVLKNAMDWVGAEWHNKPVAFVSYGSVGGARAVEQLRLIAIELQMAPIRNAVHIPGHQFFPVVMGHASADELFQSMQHHADALIQQLLWWASALKQARTQS